MNLNRARRVLQKRISQQPKAVPSSTVSKKFSSAEVTYALEAVGDLFKARRRVVSNAPWPGHAGMGSKEPSSESSSEKPSTPESRTQARFDEMRSRGRTPEQIRSIAVARGDPVLQAMAERHLATTKPSEATPTPKKGEAAPPKTEAPKSPPSTSTPATPPKAEAAPSTSRPATPKKGKKSSSKAPSKAPASAPKKAPAKKAPPAKKGAAPTSPSATSKKIKNVEKPSPKAPGKRGRKNFKVTYADNSVEYLPTDPRKQPAGKKAPAPKKETAADKNLREFTKSVNVHVKKLYDTTAKRLAAAGKNPKKFKKALQSYMKEILKTKNYLESKGNRGKSIWANVEQNSQKHFEKIMKTNEYLKKGKASSADPEILSMVKNLAGKIEEDRATPPPTEEGEEGETQPYDESEEGETEPYHRDEDVMDDMEAAMTAAEEGEGDPKQIQRVVQQGSDFFRRHGSAIAAALFFLAIPALLIALAAMI